MAGELRRFTLADVAAPFDSLSPDADIHSQDGAKALLLSKSTSGPPVSLGDAQVERT